MEGINNTGSMWININGTPICIQNIHSVDIRKAYSAPGKPLLEVFEMNWRIKDNVRKAECAKEGEMVVLENLGIYKEVYVLRIKYGNMVYGVDRRNDNSMLGIHSGLSRKNEWFMDNCNIEMCYNTESEANKKMDKLFLHINHKLTEEVRFEL